jgi:hypothetical protein
MRIYSSPDVVVDEQKPGVLVVVASIVNVRASAKFPKRGDFFHTTPSQPLGFPPNLKLQNCCAAMAVRCEIQNGVGGPIARNGSG